MRPPLILLLVIVLAACDGSQVGETSTTQTVPTTTTSTLPGSTSTTPPIGCPQEAEFVTDGQINRVTQPNSDSRALGLVSRQVVDGCERFGFDFDTAEDAPATTPPSVTAKFLDGERIIRISMDIDRTVITDQLIETRLVERLFVVRGLDGTLFVDLHLRERANARMTISNSPARLTLELHPGVGPIGPAAEISDNTVLLVPPNESVVDPEVEVSGYARAFEANVLIVATQGDDVISEDSTTAADWVDTWGEFAATVELPAGEVNLFVGEESPVDGSLQGVTLTLTVR